MFSMLLKASHALLSGNLYYSGQTPQIMEVEIELCQDRKLLIVK